MERVLSISHPQTDPQPRGAAQQLDRVWTELLATLAGMNTPEPLRAATAYDLTRAAVAAALAGDHRARRVSIGPRAGIVTPHTDPDGDLDANDLAAQIWALANDCPADDGTYTEGIFTSGGERHTIVYIPPDF